MTSRLLTMSLADYTPEGWGRLCAVADDPPAQSYAQYRAKLAVAADVFKREGMPVTMFVMDAATVDEMVAWCRQEGHLSNPEGRTLFGAYKACKLDDQAEKVLH